MAKPAARLSVRVQPGSSRNQLIALRDEVLYVKLTAPPVEGKANRQLIEFLSTALGIRKSDIRVERGTSGRNKILAVDGLSRDELIEKARKLVES